MADREKVIKGLEYCNQVEEGCEVCPYYNDFNGCMLELREDALALINEQQKLIDDLTKRRMDNGAFD